MALAPVAAIGPRDLADLTAAMTAIQVRSYLDATLTTAATMAANGFFTVVCPTVVADAKGNYNATTGIYTVPETGTYSVLTKARLAEGPASNMSYGLGAGTSNVDGSHFGWFVTAPYRNGAINIRTARFIAGNQIRMYMLLDGFTCAVNVAEFNIHMVMPG